MYTRQCTSTPPWRPAPLLQWRLSPGSPRLTRPRPSRNCRCLDHQIYRIMKALYPVMGPFPRPVFYSGNHLQGRQCLDQCALENPRCTVDRWLAAGLHCHHQVPPYLLQCSNIVVQLRPPRLRCGGHKAASIAGGCPWTATMLTTVGPLLDCLMGCFLLQQA